MTAELFGAVLMLLGGGVMLGWWLELPPLVRVLPSFTPMVFNTALAFVLAGCALLAPQAGAQRQARITSILGGLLAALAVLAYAQHALQMDFGIDWARLHGWLRDVNPHPGRMSVATATAFLLTGTVLIVAPRVYQQWMGTLVRGLIIAVGSIGLLALAGYAVNAPLLFPQYVFGQVAVHTATGLVLLALGLWTWSRQFDWSRAPIFEKENDRITAVGAAVLVATALGAGIATFGILQGRVQTLVRDDLQVSLSRRAVVLLDLIELRENNARIAATRPAATRNLRVIQAGKDDGSNIANLEAVVDSFVKQGFSGIAYTDSAGRVVASGGRFAPSPPISVALATPEKAELLWDGGFILRHRLSVQDAAGTAGSVVVEQALPVLTRMVEQVPGSGDTWDMGLCVRRGEGLLCFPQRLNPRVFTTPLVNVAGEALPMTRALSGETGTTISRDYRRQNVVAAYGPVGTLGLGIVLKVDAAEIFAPIREQLQLAAGLLTLVVAGGTLLLRSQIRPIATRLEGALEERAAGLHRAQQVAKLAHVVTRTDGSFETWSETLPPLIGVEAAGVPRTTRDWLQILHPDDRAPFRSKAIEAGTRGARTEIEYRLRRSDGAWIHVQQTMEPLGDEPRADGGHRWFNTLQDVSERRLAEEKIRHLNRVHAVLSGINSMIVRVREREELFREACRIAVEAGGFRLAWIGLAEPGGGDVDVVAWHGAGHGYVELMPLGKGRNTLGGRNLSVQAMTTRKATISTDMLQDPNILLKKESRERGFHSMAILPVLAAGDAIGVLALYAGEVGFFDAEEVKLLEELAGDIGFAVAHLDLDRRVKQHAAELNQALADLRKSEAELEQRVEQRTAELEAANHELESFSYSVSHDLRAPLRHIDGFAQMLHEECGPALDASGRRYLGVITESVKLMGQLIDDLLLFSKMGRAEMHEAQVGMDELVRNVVKELSGEIGERRIEWQIDPLPEARGDRAMLKQVWVNLLANAVKYTRPRSLAKIAVGYDRASGEYYVQDNGAGFDMAYAAKLFGVFQRLHRAEDFEGTGVGLANVQRIIARHGGRIRAHGRVDEGATFHFSLPVHHEDQT